MKTMLRTLAAVAAFCLPEIFLGFARAEPVSHLSIAAAADLHRAMDEVVAAYPRAHPSATIDVVYGSWRTPELHPGKAVWAHVEAVALCAAQAA